MAHINRRFIDKHWLVFIVRGIAATIFGFLILFSGLTSLEAVIAIVSVFLLAMGIIDATSALYNSNKRHGWINSVIDALIDITAALLLLFLARNDLVGSLIIISVYTFASGLIDIFHGFVSTVDPTDRFIRVLTGVMGCIMGLVILNAGSFEIMTFIRFFGAYLLVVGVTSMIYGVHNRSQDIEDRVARSEAKRKTVKTAAKSSAKKVAKKSSKKTKK